MLNQTFFRIEQPLKMISISLANPFSSVYPDRRSSDQFGEPSPWASTSGVQENHQRRSRAQFRFGCLPHSRKPESTSISSLVLHREPDLRVRRLCRSRRSSRRSILPSVLQHRGGERRGGGGVEDCRTPSNDLTLVWATSEGSGFHRDHPSSVIGHQLISRWRASQFHHHWLLRWWCLHHPTRPSLGSDPGGGASEWSGSVPTSWSTCSSLEFMRTEAIASDPRES